MKVGMTLLSVTVVVIGTVLISTMLNLSVRADQVSSLDSVPVADRSSSVTNETLAQQLLKTADEILTEQPTHVRLSSLLVIESLRHHESSKGEQALRQRLYLSFQTAKQFSQTKTLGQLKFNPNGTSLGCQILRNRPKVLR
ncbi:hypothetical protein QUF64_16765 [Anaerolineales bacterium HSG6]|nr:hypothetical protein [Anaerolineales bacterium HSG6]